MGSVQDELERWQRAGVIDAATRRRIEAFEAGGPSKREGPSIAEALVYLGVAVVVVGVLVLVASNWDELRGAARIGVVGLPAVLAILAGFGLRQTGEPPLERGGSVAWLFAVALAAATAAVVTFEADWSENNVALAATSAGVVVAIAAWALAPAHPQVLGVVASLGALAMALGARADDQQAPIMGVLGLCFGGVALAAAEVRAFTPRSSARLLSAVLLAGGAYIAGLDDQSSVLEGLVLVAGAGLVVLSIARGVFAYIAVGVAAIFVGLISLILREVDDPTVAALSLMVIGGAMVAGVLVLVKVRPWRTGAAAP